jgi:peptidoglycan/LPS O-acetylase OafA/YrhL
MTDRAGVTFQSEGAPHFVALDSVRGIAALLVVLYHVSWVNFVEASAFVRNSYLMVDLFFVLSGFVMAYSYGSRIASGADFFRFMWLRFWRLWPLHFTFLVVLLLIECLKAFAQWRYGLVAHNPAFTANSLGAFVGNVFLVQSLHLYSGLTFNYPSWSISVEFFTYILFGLLVLLAGSRKMLLGLSAVICAISLATLASLGPDALFQTFSFGIVRCFFGFFLGVLTFASYERMKSSPVTTAHKTSIGYVALGAAVAFCLFIGFKTPGYSDLAIYPLSVAVVFFIALAPADGPMKILRTSPFVWLGTVSYSIYMVHAAVEWGMDQVLHFLTHAKEIQLPRHDMPVLDAGGTIGIVAVIATIALVLLVSHFTFAWIEKPFRDWSKAAWPTVRTRFARGAFARG